VRATRAPGWHCPALTGQSRVQTPHEGRGKADGSQIISRELVVAGRDTSEVLELVECTLDAPTHLVEVFAEGEWALPAGAVGNDGLGSTPIQFFAQFVAVICLIAEQTFGWLDSVDEPSGNGAIVRLTAGQQDRDETAFSICECMYLRVSPAARAANSLFLLPPFPPDAERCALT
jgi:hypothetical protein